MRKYTNILKNIFGNILNFFLKLKNNKKMAVKKTFLKNDS